MILIWDWLLKSVFQCTHEGGDLSKQKQFIMTLSTKGFFIFGLNVFLFLQTTEAQVKPKAAIINIDVRNLEWDNMTIANIMRFELEKIDQFEILDKYDVSTVLEENSIDLEHSFGKNSLIEIGRLLNAEKMVTGSAELFGDKIIMILRLIDINKKSVEQTSVMEYLNIQSEIQTMCMISLNDLLGLKNDPHVVDLLINYNLPITTRKTSVSLNGPRMGMTHMMGKNGQRLTDPKSTGGYNMFPVTSMFGYQFEKQYMSSGDFQALVEVIGAVNGLESGNIIPSIAVLNGFRFNSGGYEFGIGPVIRAIKTQEGFYRDGKWVRVSEVSAVPNDIEVLDLIDSRGNLRGSVGLLVAVGKTFKSGYLNIPVNVFFSPLKDGSSVGLSIGFNTTKKPSL